MKNVFRYKMPTIGIILGIGIALISLFYADFMRNLNELEESEKEALQYEYQYCFTSEIKSEKDCEFISDVLKGFPATVIAENVSLYVDAECSEHLCSIVVTQDAPLKYSLSSGRYPTEEELVSGEPVVVLGRGMKDCVFKEGEEEYILICGEKYHVVGYCSGINTTITNYSVILFSGCLGAQTSLDFQQAGNTRMHTYSLNSDSSQVKDIFLPFREELESAGIQVGILTEYVSDFTGSQYRSEYTNLAYLLYFFSIFITLTVTQFWIYCRRYEFAIRRIYGYGIWKLCIYIVMELSKLLLISFCFSLLAYGGIAFAYYILCGIRLPVNIILVCHMIIIAFITLLLVVICAIWNTFRREPLSLYRR